MYSDSHKPQRNSFAHHRAELLLKLPEALASDVREWSALIPKRIGTLSVRRDTEMFPRFRREWNRPSLTTAPTEHVPTVPPAGK
jgi:hypothetical protein